MGTAAETGRERGMKRKSGWKYQTWNEALREHEKIRKKQRLDKKTENSLIYEDHDEKEFNEFNETLTKYIQYCIKAWIMSSILIKMRSYSMQKSIDTEEVVKQHFTFTNPILNFVAYPIIQTWLFWWYPMDLFLDAVFPYILPVYNFIDNIINGLTTYILTFWVKLVQNEITKYEILMLYITFCLVTFVYFLLLKIYRYFTNYDSNLILQELKEKYIIEKSLTATKKRLEEKKGTTKISDSESDFDDYIDQFINSQLYAIDKKHKKENKENNTESRNDDVNDSVNEKPKHEKVSKSSKVCQTVFSCWMCNKPSKSMLKCSVCRKARYCGETCQWKDWGRHKKICKDTAEKRQQKEKKKRKKN